METCIVPSTWNVRDMVCTSVISVLENENMLTMQVWKPYGITYCSSVHFPVIQWLKSAWSLCIVGYKFCFLQVTFISITQWYSFKKTIPQIRLFTQLQWLPAFMCTGNWLFEPRWFRQLVARVIVLMGPYGSPIKIHKWIPKQRSHK